MPWRIRFIPLEASSRSLYDSRCTPSASGAYPCHARGAILWRLSPLLRQSASWRSLLSATGLRISEAIALNIDCIADDVLIIKATKFRKDRLVPLHQSAYQAILRYMKLRMKLSSIESAFFVSNSGARLSYSTVNSIFLQLVRAIGLRGAPGESGVCIHDLRHTFAVRSLEQCAGNRVAISQHMTALSTYLGHAHISDTYWYLQATPTLLAQISADQEACHRREGND